MPKFRKKPVVIEAKRWTGDNTNEILEFVEQNGYYTELNGIPLIGIFTLEGKVYASKLDWIIKGVQGEFYPCKPEIFEQTYEWVPDVERVAEGVYEPVDESCTCGKGDDASAIVHDDDCPCIHWVAGQLEG